MYNCTVTELGSRGCYRSHHAVAANIILAKRIWHLSEVVPSRYQPIMKRDYFQVPIFDETGSWRHFTKFVAVNDCGLTIIPQAEMTVGL